MTDDRLTAEELTNLVKRVFKPRPEDHALAVIVDLPDDEEPDSQSWRERRALAAGWVRELAGAQSDHGLEISLFLYPQRPLQQRQPPRAVHGAGPATPFLITSTP